MSHREFESADHSRLYSEYRSSPPSSLLAEIVDFLDGGDGKKAERAVAECSEAANLDFGVSPAESLPVPDSSAKLVLVVQALHWFDLDAFFREADRVLAPGGILAVVSYATFPKYSKTHTLGKMRCYSLVERCLAPGDGGDDGESDAAAATSGELDQFYKVVRDFGNPRLDMWADDYAAVTFPYQDQKRTGRHLTARPMSSSALRDYCRSYSLYQNMADRAGKEEADKALDGFIDRTMEAHRRHRGNAVEPSDEAEKEGDGLELVHAYRAVLCRKPAAKSEEN